MQPVTAAETPRVKARSRLTPVRFWATVGALFVVFEAYVLGSWILGPNFTPVTSGPDDPPGWMKAALIFGQVFFTGGALVFLYKLLWLPIWRERRISTDGMLCVAALCASPFDMLSNYFDYWFTYNSYLVNQGSIMSELPGVSQPHGADVGETWPLLLLPGAYVVIFVGMAIVGCAFMRRLKRRKPSIGNVKLVALCFVFTMLFYLVIEGVICMPLGYWAFQGGHLSINPSHYYKYPIQEMITAGAVFTIFTCWRYFVNDRGDTLAERGVERLRLGKARETAVRQLALIGIVIFGMVATYHLPNGLLAMASTPWPEDLQTRSYLTNNICGPDVGKVCPGSQTIPDK